MAGASLNAIRPSETRCADDTCRTVFGSRRLCAASGTFAIVAVTAGPTLRQPACAANAMPIMAQSGRLSFTSPLKAGRQRAVKGKGVSVHVELGGCRVIKKKKK